MLYIISVTECACYSVMRLYLVNRLACDVILIRSKGWVFESNLYLVHMCVLINSLMGSAVKKCVGNVGIGRGVKRC